MDSQMRLKGETEMNEMNVQRCKQKRIFQGFQSNIEASFMSESEADEKTRFLMDNNPKKCSSSVVHGNEVIEKYKCPKTIPLRLVIDCTKRYYPPVM
jgi:hypothetical protein